MNSAESWEPQNVDTDSNRAPPSSQKAFLPTPAEPTLRLNQHRLQSSDYNWNEPTWKQVQTVYPDVMEPSLTETMAPKLPPLEGHTKTATPIRKDPLPAARQQEPTMQPQTVQPLEVFPAARENLSNRSSVSSLSNILAPLVAPVSELQEPTPKEARSPPREATPYQPTHTTIKITHQGKALRHHVSAADSAQLTEVIKSALGGGKSHGERETETHQAAPLERNSLPSGKSSSGDIWPNSALSPAKSNGSDKPADSQSSQDYDEDLEKKAIEVLKTLHKLGYTIHKDAAQAPKSLNPGSAASSKSENLVTCQKCFKFKGRPCELK